MLPSTFDPEPHFPEAKAIIQSLYAALDAAKPGRTVVLSSIGAQVTRPSLLTPLHDLEEKLGTLTTPVAFLRACWFMENAGWDVPSALNEGQITSFLLPVERPIPMVATRDIGSHAAELLQSEWQGKRVVQLEGPEEYSPKDVAETFTRLLENSIDGQGMPRDDWRGFSAPRARAIPNRASRCWTV